MTAQKKENQTLAKKLIMFKLTSEVYIAEC